MAVRMSQSDLEILPLNNISGNAAAVVSTSKQQQKIVVSAVTLSRLQIDIFILDCKIPSANQNEGKATIVFFDFQIVLCDLGRNQL